MSELFVESITTPHGTIVAATVTGEGDGRFARIYEFAGTGEASQLMEFWVSDVNALIALLEVIDVLYTDSTERERRKQYREPTPRSTR